ncbi:sigma-54-dependent transcriptional regulator [Snuella sedimenti]|uniref:Sigma-54-dependent Fis family transcriptional regulator n=1 Tax=Snuella sedimenti TaxID=2798802 RepID=A0A8J7IPH5_9FLAO|nr:sigma-54 dependent transcriptional regulator [Snuella sedimenti]MBJ6368547.1 sigma-54-dependent Fis family transcriptional regulator [Snuella sedimenti]
MIQAKILVIDDNKSVLSALELLLQAEYQTVATLSNPNAITSITNLASYDVILLDMNFSAGVNTGNEGFYWLTQLKALSPDASIVMITAYGDVEIAVKALKEGATDFILKPWDNKKLLATLHAAYKFRQSRLEVKALKSAHQNLKSLINNEGKYIIGQSKAINKILKLARKVACTNANVLITGENGTGKELIAQEIHRNSKRNQGILVNVDMGAIAETLFESELFGHVKGAFTDAHKDRPGKFEAANGGTLFLDEIGNLPLPLQSKLLSVLQNRQVFRVGSNTGIAVDIRIICATNGDLESLVSEGHFREDLLYRINTIHIEVPPLRDRDDDVLLLADFFLKKYANKYGKKVSNIAASAKRKLLNYNWPGNVRELQHTIERAVILSDGTILNTNDFLFKTPTKAKAIGHLETLDAMEKQMISNALERHDHNFTAAANQLGITRQTLYNKAKRYGIQ